MQDENSFLPLSGQIKLYFIWLDRVMMMFIKIKKAF